MRKSLLILAILFTYSNVQSQEPKLSLNALGGYVFNDNFSTPDYYGTLKGGFQWQVGLEAGLKNFYGIELYYVRQDGTANINAPLISKETDVAMNYVMLGGKRYSYLGSDKLMAWGGLSLGAAFGHNKSSDDDFTKFAWGARCGLKAKPNSQSAVAFLFQVQLLSAVQAGSGGFYFGTTGSGVGYSTYSTIYQFGLSGGIAIRMK